MFFKKRLCPYCLEDVKIKRDKNKKLVIGALMRKLLHLAFGVLKNDQPFDPQWMKISAANS